MTRWQTIVEIDSPCEKINYEDGIMFFGSCFAEEIGSRMERADFDVAINPFGVLYNPISISSCIERVHSGALFAEDELFYSGGVWRSFMHSSEFSTASKDQFLEKNNRLLLDNRDRLHKSEWMVITLGTAYIYKLSEDCGSIVNIATGYPNRVVNNCHKLPNSYFKRERLTEKDVFTHLESIITKLPEKRWIITISPVRHWKDGAHNNQISKAILLLATEMLQRKYKNVFYFPAYELAMDELRDYRFYAGDMLHLSKEAIDYIYERFIELYIGKESRDRLKMTERLNRMDGHKPFFPNSEEFKIFQKNRDDMVKKIENLKKKA